MRISRPCYDKYHRCPGWAGGGMRYGKRDLCQGGSLSQVINYDSKWWRWKIHQCPTCHVYVLPYNFHYVDPTYWIRGGIRIQWFMTRQWFEIMWWKIQRRWKKETTVGE